MKEQSKKITIATTLIMLAALLFVAVFGIVTKGYKDYSMLHPDDALEIENPPAAIDGDGNIMDTSTIYPMPSNMIFASTAAAEDGITIRATLKPDNATFKDVTWSLSFVNPASAWATGKTPEQYVRYFPDIRDNKIVEILLMKLFGEQLKLTATSVDNPSISASCIIDCAEQRNIVGENIDLLDTNGNNALQYYPDAVQYNYVNINKNNTIKYIPKYNYTANPYTIAATYTAHYELSVSPAFIKLFPIIDKYASNNLHVEFSKLETNTVNIDNGVIFDDNLLVQIFGPNILKTNEYKIFCELLMDIGKNPIFFTDAIVDAMTKNGNTLTEYQPYTKWAYSTRGTIDDNSGSNTAAQSFFKLSCKIDSNYGYSSQWYNTFSINKNTFDCSVSVNGISLDQQGLVL